MIRVRHNRIACGSGKTTRCARPLRARHDKAIFDTGPIEVTLDDVDDCLHATRNMQVPDRRNYFCSQGVDYDKVVQYLDTVNKLNARVHSRAQACFFETAWSAALFCWGFMNSMAW
jgi:hypothetical protein